MFDFSQIYDAFSIVPLLACLACGYLLKHASLFSFIDNDNIPLILAVLGAIFNVLTAGFSFDVIVYGAVMGLASTGMHQAFKNFIDKGGE